MSTINPEPGGCFSRYEYFYDRNALRSIAVAGSSIIALTQAGHLLRFDRQTLGLTGELLSLRAATTIGAPRDESVLVGFAGGRIDRLDVESMRLEALFEVPGIPIWLGATHDHQEVAVYDSMARDLVEAAVIRRARDYRFTELTSRREIKLEGAFEEWNAGLDPSALLLDSRDRLWVGTDFGEFGGGVGVLDVKSGVAQGIPRVAWGRKNVSGFVEPKPGVIWAFGGIEHMTAVQATVTRVAPMPLKPLYAFEGTSALSDHWRRLSNSHPLHAPVRQIIPYANRMLWIMTSDALLESDPEFKRLRRIGDFSSLKKGPNEMGPDEPEYVESLQWDSSRLIAATWNHGLVTFESGQFSAYSLANQLPGTPVRALTTPSGLVFIVHYGAAWRTKSGTWRSVPFSVGVDHDHPAPVGEEILSSQDPDVVEVRHAIQEYLLQGARPSTVPWDSEHWLLTQNGALCLTSPRENRDACVPITPTPIASNPSFTAVARDDAGTIWLGGQGLWFFDSSRRLVPAGSGLPFLADTIVTDLKAVDGKLVLSLKDRGVALLDPRDLSRVACTIR